jgi:hypothetical protein
MINWKEFGTKQLLGLIEVLFLNMSGGTEENYENPQTSR